MTKTVTIKGLLPTARVPGPDGTALPLTPADVDHVEVSLSADAGATFTDIGKATIDDTGGVSFVQPNLIDGDYVFGFIVVDKQSPPQAGAAATLAVTVKSAVLLPAPGQVTDLTATVS